MNLNTVLLSLEKLPEFISVNDLIELGIFTNNTSAYLARRRGQSPDYIKLNKKIIYAKSSVIEWIKINLKDGSYPKLHKKEST